MFNNIHLWLSRNYKTIQHWLLVIVGIVLLIFSMIVIAGQNRLINQVKDLSAQNKVLAEDNKKLNEASKALGEDNKSIAKQNRAYTRCIAEVFAKFTRDQAPIANFNLDNCTTDSQTRATNNTPDTGTPVSSDTSNNTSAATPAVPQQSLNVVPYSSQSPSSNPTPTSPVPQPNNSQTLPILPFIPCIIVGNNKIC